MALKGTLHPYTPRLSAFEHSPPQSSFPTPTDSSLNTLLWIGGLGDGLLTVNYPTAIAQCLPSNWRIVEVLLSSSYSGWATGSLKRDAEEIGEAVKYFRGVRKEGKVVGIGHSTGCQGWMEVLVGPRNSGEKEEVGEKGVKLDGVILQAGVSDREALILELEKEDYDATNILAKRWVEEGRQDDVLPKTKATGLFGASMTAYRWLSLASPEKNGDDDYFSTDLPDEVLKRTFGRIGEKTRMAFLWGERDQFVPEWVDKEGVLERWMEIVEDGGGKVDRGVSGVVKGASHNLNGDSEEVVQELVRRVVRFLDTL